MRYFKLEEFDSPDEPGSGSNMHEEILHMLDVVRKKYGKPIKINSGYRTVDRNKKIGGVKNSSHLKGLAVDISCKESKDRFILLNLLIEVGFRRIGIAKSFIHVDIDKNKSQDVAWGY
jgi:zinc D-Ala-D-Ala carboxypeptidase|tara:strand:- start:418 stop:771 length:354 start_codon:yes stop_codon:yes gene_type:complete